MNLHNVMGKWWKSGSSDSINKWLFLWYQICEKHVDVWKINMFHTHFSQNYICSCLPAYHIQIRVFKVLFQERKEKPLKVLIANI